MFWKIAKKIHPDVSSIDLNNELFIKLQADYQSAIEQLKKAKSEIEINKVEYSKDDCINLFVELMASNFPIDKSINNVSYKQRIEKLNTGINMLNKNEDDLFKKFEKEMYNLKGNTVVSNHEFNVLKLYLYRFCDNTYISTKNNKNYLCSSYDLIINICILHRMYNSIKFINWLVEDLVGTNNVRKNVPTTSST